MDKVPNLFKDGHYTNIPNCYLMPDYIQQVGADGLLFITQLVKALDNGVYRNKLTDGRMAIPDTDLAKWAGERTTSRIRRGRKLVLKATPPFLSGHRMGCNTRPSVYQIRRLTEDDRVTFPLNCFGMVPLRRSTDAVGVTERRADWLGEAITYLGRRFSLMPVRRETKKPWLTEWKPLQTSRASLDESKHGAKWPSANLAVVTGALSNLAVLDLDGPRQKGLELLAAHGICLPHTTEVASGKGTAFLVQPSRTKSDMQGEVSHDGDDVSFDVRGDGGYIIVPPSEHANGTRYRFVDEVDELPVFPSELLDLMEKPIPQSARGKKSPEARNRIPQAGIDDVLGRVDIVDVIEGSGVALTQKPDGDFIGLCPFHLTRPRR